MDVTDVIGSTGKAQYKALIALLVRPLPGTFIYLSLQISLIELDHWCSPTAEYRNITSEDWKECCVPMTSKNHYSRCEYKRMMFDQNDTEQTLTCSNWDYNTSIPYKSARAEWNLVCSRGWYVSMLYMAFTIGNLVAYIPSGHIADRFGRKPVSMLGLVLGAGFSLISAFCTSVEYMMITRFLSGITYAATQNSFIILYLECVGQQYRNWIILSFSGAWGICYIITAGISYFITDWRILFYLASVPAHLPAFLLLWMFIPESARWLLSVKRYEEAEKVVLQQAKENGIVIVDSKSIIEKLKLKVHMDKEKEEKATFLDLFKDPNVRRTTIALYVILFLTVFVNHGYNVAIVRLDGSLHINLMFSGLIDFCSLALFFIILKYLSKKRGLLLCFILTGSFFLLTIPIGNDLRWLRVLFAMLARFCNATAYNLLYIFASEVFPTNLRVVGVGGGMTAGRIGSILSSFADDMGRVYGRSAPLGLFGITSLVTCAVFLLLPELTIRLLPDSLEETKIITSGKAEPQQPSGGISLENNDAKL